jgi:hypothetical protein
MRFLQIDPRIPPRFPIIMDFPLMRAFGLDETRKWISK